MFGPAYRIATAWGIPIRIHISLILLMVLLVLEAAPLGLDVALLNLLFVASVFASIALHELGHSIVALRKGYRVRRIDLLFIGGAAQMERIPRRPADELVMALAGPAVSLALAALLRFGGGWAISRGWMEAGMLLRLLARTNFILALFNLIPAFPMDGGRVLRALLSRRMGRLGATYLAARIGRTLALLFGVAALLNLFTLAGMPLQTGNRIIIAAIAFFVFRAAGAEYRAVQMEELAHREPFGPIPPPIPEPFETSDDERVIVSPSPYSRGRQKEMPIRPVHDPFSDE